MSAASRCANSAEGHEDWVDAVVDEECDFIEDILGAAFVVCQTRVTSITSLALQLRETTATKGAPFMALGGRKEDVRALGEAASLSAMAGPSGNQFVSDAGGGRPRFRPRERPSRSPGLRAAADHLTSSSTLAEPCGSLGQDRCSGSGKDLRVERAIIEQAVPLVTASTGRVRNANDCSLGVEIGECLVCFSAHAHQRPIGGNDPKFLVQVDARALAQCLEREKAARVGGVLALGELGPQDRARQAECICELPEAQVVPVPIPDVVGEELHDRRVRTAMREVVLDLPRAGMAGVDPHHDGAHAAFSLLNDQTAR